ncbi:MAG: hypothetical protein ACP5E5_11790 [Acidobacteriaceae bacterium]
MTPDSLLHLLLALCWVSIVFLSISGLGSLLLWGSGLRRPALPLAAVAGFGVAIFLGGCMNLRQAISYPGRLSLIAMGLLSLALTRPRILRYSTGSGLASKATLDLAISPRSRSAARLILGLAALVFVIRFAATVHTPYYQHDDDYNFYLAAPVKMDALHQYAPDPFSERRVMSSLGGNYFLQSLVLTELPLEDVQMADRAFGLLLLACVAGELGAVFGLYPLQQALLVLFLLITPQLQFNLTFVDLPFALFVGLVYLAADLHAFAAHPRLQAVLLGITASAISTLKSTYLPHGVLFLLCIALLHAHYRGLRVGLNTLLLEALGCLAVLIPWMIASHSASGTWFYPILGKGYQYSTYGLFPPPSAGHTVKIVAKVMIFNLPLAAVLLLEWFWCKRDERTRVLVALTVAALSASVLVGLATGGDSVRRYNYPAILAAILLLYPAAAAKANLAPSLRSLSLKWASAAICVCLAMYVGFNSWTHEYAMTLKCLRTSLADYHIEPESTVLAYQAMERAIPTTPRNAPAGQSDGTIATVDFPFLFDFRSYPIAIADIPGAASLPPGWPSRSSGDVLASYLLSHHLRYLALTFDSSTLSNVSLREQEELADPNTTQWIRSEAQIRLAGYRQFEQLIHSRRHIFDQGNLVVLDLATPAR